MIMEFTDLLFWNVDTQIDFIEPHGELYVSGAEKIKPVLGRLTKLAKKCNIKVINTCDYHQINSTELSSNPNYIDTFPPHCMAGTKGVEYIPETMPEIPVIIDWEPDIKLSSEIWDQDKYRNIVLRKDDFDVFKGNPYTEKVLEIINPELVFVYGVTTNVCVDKAVRGLVERGKKVFVVKDAIRELPDLPLPFDEWKSLGVEMITYLELEKAVLISPNLS